MRCLHDSTLSRAGLWSGKGWSQVQLKLIIDSIVWAFRHTERNVAETGLNLLLDMLNNFSTSDFATQFYQTYYLQLVQPNCFAHSGALQCCVSSSEGSAACTHREFFLSTSCSCIMQPGSMSPESAACSLLFPQAWLQATCPHLAPPLQRTGPRPGPGAFQHTDFSALLIKCCIQLVAAVAGGHSGEQMCPSEARASDAHPKLHSTATPASGTPAICCAPPFWQHRPLRMLCMHGDARCGPLCLFAVVASLSAGKSLPGCCFPCAEIL
eukprot:scaffold139673_cov19-Tisochrysis_lutea.AAC.2